MLWRVGAGFVVVGMLGLAVGWILFPKSNLLGGLALLFAPLVWIGAVMLVLYGFGRLWLAVTHWLNHRKT